MCPPCRPYLHTWTCSACEHSGRLEISYEEGSWTDSQRPLDLAGAPSELPTIVRCPACDQLQRAKGLAWGADDSLPKLRHSREQDYLDALTEGLYESRREKLDLRLRAWRAGNDASRVEGARAQIRSAEAQANLEALYELLCEDPSEALIKAEVARQLGRFDDALELCSGLSRLVQAQSPARTIARLAREGSEVVAEVEWEDNAYSHRFTCPHCQRPGRLDFTGYLEAERHAVDSGLPADHAVRCGACRGVVWRGANRRVGSLALETFSDGAVAALGCLAVPSAILLGIASPRAGLGVLLGYCALVAASWVAGVVRQVVYPNSRPLTDMDLEELLEERAWNGPEEERWVRLSVLHARTRIPEIRSGLDSNAVALISLLGTDPHETWLEAKIRRRAGDLEGAREVAERLAASDDEWNSRRAKKLIELIDAGDHESSADALIYW